MKKILKFFPFLLLLLFPFLALSQWSKVADLPQYKWRLAGFSIGTKGYIVGGITETATTFTGANPSANLWIYDSQTDTWSAGPDFPGGNIRRAFVFVINDIAYVGSGENTGFYAYDPSTNAWTQKANRPNVGEFYQAIGFAVNGVGYAGMGGSANLYKYTPSTNTWSTAIATGIPTRGSAFVFVYNNKAYIGGGNNGGTYYNTFYQFDPATNTSTQLANYPTLYTLYSYGFSNAQGGGVASGYAGYNNHHTYNISTNTWTAATSIPSSPQWGTQEAAGFNIGSNLYIIGGTTGSTALNRTIKFTNVVLPPTITALSPNPVTTGQTLTITGTNFTGATGVTINGTSVPFTVASATSITVVVPTGTTSGKVIVTTPGGTADGAVEIASNTSAPASTGWTNAWQKLTTTTAGYLKSVTLKLDNTDASNDYGLYLELHATDADPSSANPWNKFTGSSIENSATLTMLRNTASGEVTFTFPGTVKLNANATYFVRLKEAAGNPGGTGNQRIYKLSSTSGTTDGGSGNNFGTLYYKFSMAPHLTVIYPAPTITALSPNPVTTGQTLTITGTNFTGATGVTINGTSVPFTVASATSITVVVPTGTTSGKVIVTTPGGTADGAVEIASNTSAPASTGWTNAWQKLTTTTAGYLKSVTLKLDNTDASNDYGLYLELHATDADPSSANPWNKFTGSSIENSATLTMLRNTASGEVTFTFPGTVKLNANATYFVRLKEAAGNPGGTGNQRIYKLSSTSGTTDGGSGNNFGTLYYKFSMAPHLIVINPANISVTSNLTPFSSCEGSPSAPQSFTATGNQLTAPLSILAPTGFEISTNETTGFSSTLTLNPFSAVAVPGSVEYCYISPDASSGQTTVYVDMRQFTSGVLPEEVGYLQLLDLYTGPAKFLFSDVGGWARYSIPVDLTNTSGSAYTANFRSNAYGETNITVDFQFSSGNTINLPIYVRLLAAATGSPMGNVTLSSIGATSVNVAVSGTVNAKPPVPAVSNVTACQDLSIPNTFLSALTATGTNLLWYTSATGGVGSANAPIPQASTPGTTSYWVTQTNANGCESDRAQIDVLINPIPTFNQPPNQTIVNGTAIQPINFVGTVPNTTFSWTILNSGWGIPTTGVGNIPAYVVDANLAGSPSAATTIIVTPTANGCVGAPRNILLTILSPNSAPTNISLSKTNLFEANALGATVGNLSSTDPDVGDTHTYALVGGSGGGDNASFTIVGNQLKANAVFNFAAKRLYAVRIRTTDAGGLPFEKEFLISISKTPVVLGTGNVPSTKKQTAPSANPSISKGYNSFLTVTGENLTGYSWSPSTGLSANNISNPVASPDQTTTYNVTVTNSFGSTTVVPISITVLDDYNVTPNNLLTPNGDGLNDTWAVENIASYPNNEIKVVDKAGRLVFTQKGYANTWDGANLIPDTYYYIIIFGPDVAPKKGFITIIR
jgi:gliding motility-associated-like protein